MSTNPSDTGLPETAADIENSETPQAIGAEQCCGKAAGRPRAADVEARLNNLLETAACLFLKKGYANVSLEAIAREAHVAVRTIYVKFGGKAGLLKEIIIGSRARFFANMHDMETDTRPLAEILGDFGQRFMGLIMTIEATKLHRMVICEALTNPEVAEAFNQAGPQRTRDMLRRLFSRPDVLAQMRAGLEPEMLALHFLNCIMGDQIGRFLFDVDIVPTPRQVEQRVALGLDLFLHGVLRRD